VRLLLGGNVAGQHAAVASEREVHHVGDGQFLAVVEVVNDQIAGDLRRRLSSPLLVHATALAAALLLLQEPVLVVVQRRGLLLFRRRRFGGGRLVVDQALARFLGQRESPHGGDRRHLAVGEVQDADGGLLRWGLASRLGLGRRDGEDDVLAVGRELRAAAEEAAAFRGRGALARRRRRRFGRTRVLVLGATGEVADDQLGVPVAGGEVVGRELAVVGEHRLLDGAPVLVILVRQRPLGGRLLGGAAVAQAQQDGAGKGEAGQGADGAASGTAIEGVHRRLLAATSWGRMGG